MRRRRELGQPLFPPLFLPLALFGLAVAFLFAGIVSLAEPADPPGCKREALAVVVDLSHVRHANLLAHERRALDTGEARVLTLERDRRVERRRESLRGIPTRPGFDRDEYPPAVSAEGGTGSSVEYVPSAENASGGAILGAQLRGFCDGQRFIIEATP